MKKNIPKNKGFLLVLLLVYGSVFFIILIAFFASIMFQLQNTQRLVESEKVLNIAEAGLEYYKWYLAHFPGDTTHGTGVDGPFIRPFSDPEGGIIGEYEIEVTGNYLCNEVSAIDIRSTGRLIGGSIERTLYARYARPSIAEFSFVINSNVWAGFSRDITGPYHSNGFIRMDGVNHSIVTSQQDRWNCDDNQLNCSGAEYNGSTVSEGDDINAIFGSGPGSDLWSNPAPPIDFGGLLISLADMRSRAIDDGGIFINNTSHHGYQVHFNGDETFTVSEVTTAPLHWEYSSAEGSWYQTRRIVTGTTNPVTYTIPDSCPVIFIEDNVWLSGVVDSKVSIAVANPSSTSVQPTIVLQGNITYNQPDAGLFAIAEQDVLLGIDIPNNMELNGIFVAQNGHFGRNHYTSGSLPPGYSQYVTRATSVINGTIVSNGRVGTQWIDGSGNTVSGILDRTNTYDRDLVEEPPPLTPYVSDRYRFVEWLEI